MTLICVITLVCFHTNLLPTLLNSSSLNGHALWMLVGVLLARVTSAQIACGIRCNFKNLTQPIGKKLRSMELPNHLPNTYQTITGYIPFRDSSVHRYLSFVRTVHLFLFHHSSGSPSKHAFGQHALRPQYVIIGPYDNTYNCYIRVLSAEVRR